MIQKEVMAMSDEQLRVKAAELMEWTEIALEDGCLVGVPPCWKDQLPPGKTTKVDLPDYPNDIAAAWELLTKARRDPTLSEQFCDAMDDTVSADTWSARAITRAFILAMTEEDK